VFFVPPGNTVIVPQLGHYHFLPNLFQFIIHQSSYHSALYNVDSDDVIKCPTKEKEKLDELSNRNFLVDPQTMKLWNISLLLQKLLPHIVKCMSFDKSVSVQMVYVLFIVSDEAKLGSKFIC
jgi:hypothetical protein